MIDRGKAQAFVSAVAVMAVINAGDINQLLEMQLPVVAQCGTHRQQMFSLDDNGQFIQRGRGTDQPFAQDFLDRCRQGFDAFGHEISMLFRCRLSVRSYWCV